MSLGRLVPVALAVGFGVLNGYVTFGPAFQELEAEKMKKEAQAKADLGPNMIEIPIEKTNPAGAACGAEISRARRSGESAVQIDQS